MPAYAENHRADVSEAVVLAAKTFEFLQSKTASPQVAALAIKFLVAMVEGSPDGQQQQYDAAPGTMHV